MSNLEDEYPTLTADAVTNPDSARLLALLAKTEKVLNEFTPPPAVGRRATPNE
jgi:hypothetical protein